MRARPSFRSLLATERPLIKPGAHDVISARLIEDAGFKAIAVGGLALLASQRGLPDIGLAALTDMVEAARHVVEATDLPCGVDGDDGYGDVKSVARTVMAYERLGVGSIIFEDQDIRAKRPGEGKTTRVVPAEEMVRKLKVAVTTRDDRETLILARTDAHPIEGFDAAIRRADAYLKAGADGIFVSGLNDPAELRRIGARLKGAIQVATVTERLLHLMPPPSELWEMGFGMVVYPQFVTTRTAAAAKGALSDLKRLSQGTIAPAKITQLLDQSDGLQAIARLPKWLKLETDCG
ncbi:isocitrate lyase/PEP mutase family protein [Terrarubrum flagellatum]|uniref:isocitrate lyase/PEP mutase family protein n=1 Tax=Terrirubrum flagellatum TaxID=2895980 RepID=UPI003144F211